MEPELADIEEDRQVVLAEGLEKGKVLPFQCRNFNHIDPTTSYYHLEKKYAGKVLTDNEKLLRKGFFDLDHPTHHTTCMRVGYGPESWGYEEAMREMLQNVVDQCFLANGSSFDGMVIERGVRKVGRTKREEQVEILHNGKFILAEITTTKKTVDMNGPDTGASNPSSRKSEEHVIEMITYGAGPRREILDMGYSSKKEQPGFIGCHGEGMKVATSVLLKLQMTVTFDSIFEHSYSRKTKMLVSERWRAYPSKGTVCYSFANHKPTQRDHDPARPDMDRFVVTVAGEEVGEHRISFADYLLPLEIVNSRSLLNIPKEAGMVILDEEYEGFVYVKHFKAGQMRTLKLGYDFPAVKLGRDRNVISPEIMVQEVAKALSAALVSPAQSPSLLKYILCPLIFGKNVNQNHNNNDEMKAPDGEEWSHTIEFQALSSLTMLAKMVLSQYLPKDVVPVTSMSEFEALKDLEKLRGYMVPEWLYKIVVGLGKKLSFQQVMENMKMELLECNNVVEFPYVKMIQDALKVCEKDVNVKMVRQENNPLKISEKWIAEKENLMVINHG